MQDRSRHDSYATGSNSGARTVLLIYSAANISLGFLGYDLPAIRAALEGVKAEGGRTTGNRMTAATGCSQTAMAMVEALSLMDL